MDKQPLVSLCITCYNQAQYIRAAVQSALAQTYSPLEIVILDDCSTDGTDRLVEEMVASYKGPHKIVFHRNETNLFVARNYEKAFKVAHGELLVTGAGDDISMPDRVARIVQAWLDAGRKPSLIQHGWIAIDGSGNELRRDGPWDVRSQLGAVSTYRREVIETTSVFPEDRNIYEDGILSLRALSCGDVLDIKEPLIYWRVSTGESTRGGFREKRRRIALHQVLSCRYYKSELNGRMPMGKDEYVEKALEVMDWRLRHYSAEYDVCAGRFPWTRLSGLKRLSPENGWNMSGYTRWMVYGSFVPPLGLGVLIRLAARTVVFIRLPRLVRWARRLFSRQND